MNNDKIYVSESCILTIVEADNQYVLTLTNNDKIEKIYQSEDKGLVMKLMLDIANVKKQDTVNYEPKNDINRPFKPTFIEKTVLMPGKVEKNIKKYDSVMTRIKDKAMLKNMPEDISKDIDEFNIKEAEVLSALEESKKIGVDFYDYLRLTLDGLKEKKGKDSLAKKISSGEIDCQTNTITTMRSKLKSIKETNTVIIPNDELTKGEIHYVLESKKEKDVSYLVVDNKETSEVLELKEVVNSGKVNNPSDMFEYHLIRKETYHNENEKEKFMIEMKDDIDEILVNEEEYLELDNTTTTLTTTPNEIKSIDDYFNNSLSSIMDAYKDVVKKDDKPKAMNNIDDILDTGNFEYEIIVYVSSDRIPIILYSNEDMSVKDTSEMDFIETVNNDITLGFSPNEIVTIGYDKYNDENGEDYYVVYIVNKGEEPQIIFGHNSLDYVTQFIDNVTNIISSL